MTTVAEKVFSAAKDGVFDNGLIEMLDTMGSCDRQVAICKASYDECGQCYIPLVIAARNGFENVVDILINRYHANTEQEGHLKIDDFLIEGATPLWCASAVGHLPIVKLLVKAGANVNHEVGSLTPVRIACFYKHLDIVRYVADNGADLNQLDKYNGSCLMTACAKGYSDIVGFLLEKGVDVNQKDRHGSNAMHFAAEEGHLDIVKLLVNAGVKMQVDSNGMTPLMLTAQRERIDKIDFLLTRTYPLLMSTAEERKIDVVEFLLTQDDHVTKKEKIDALELLGASHVNCYCDRLDLCYKFLHRAMLLRFDNPDDPYPKSEYAEVIPAYGLRGECKNLSELEGIRKDSDALCMEALMIRERILGKHNPAVAESVISRAEHLIQSRFEDCIPLYLYGFYLLRINKCSIRRDLLPFFKEFFRVHFDDTPIQRDCVNAVLEAGLEQLARFKVKISDSKNVDGILEDEMENILCMISIMTKIKNMLSEAQIKALEQLIYNIVKLGAVTRWEGYTLLHLSVRSMNLGYLCSFPCANTAIQLIKCGADVNAMDKDRNTPFAYNPFP